MPKVMGEIRSLGRIKAFDSLRLLPQTRKKSNQKEVSRMKNTNKGNGEEEIAGQRKIDREHGFQGPRVPGNKAR